MTDALLRQALRVLDRYAVTLSNPDLKSIRDALENHQTDGNGVQRDDVLQVMMAIDDLPP